MELLESYFPLIIFVLFTIGLLLVTASDRDEQIIQLKKKWPSLIKNMNSKELIKMVTIRRIIFSIIFLYLATFTWTYQTLQNRVLDLLAEKKIEGVKVHSLRIPSMAFFKSDYNSNTGLRKFKKRQRVDISVQGHVWSGFKLDISQKEIQLLSRITGKKFVFSYITGVKKLKPVIHRHMKREMTSKQIDAYIIEHFDNRGPYIIVVLNEKNRNKDKTEISSTLADRLYKELTIVKGLKVNQVVVKITDPSLYIDNNYDTLRNRSKISIIGRGTAGTY